MIASELIKFIQENKLEDYDIEIVLPERPDESYPLLMSNEIDSKYEIVKFWVQ